MPGFTPVNALKRTSERPLDGLEGDGTDEAPQNHSGDEVEPDPTAMSPAAFAEQFAAEVKSLLGPQAIKSPNPNFVVDTNSLKPNRPTVQISQRVNAKTGVVIVSSQKGDSHHASPFVYPQQRSRALPPLDKSTVALPTTDASRYPRGRPGRPFGLVEAPTLYPSAEQFRDPIRYINSVFPLGSQYGVVKISPPESWMPPFCIDTEMFWFKTRVQGLNSAGIEHAKREFITAVYAFHQGERRTSREPRIPRLPLIDKRPLDLFQLYQCVQLRGGYRHVTEKKLWAQIGRELGYTGKIMTSLSTSLKSAYYRILSPFEEHMKSQQKALVTDGAKIAIPQLVEEEYVLADEQEENQAKRVKLSEESGVKSNRSKRQYPRVAGAHTRLHRVAKSRKDSHNIVADPFMAIIHDPNWHHGYPEFDDEDFDFREAATYNLRQFQQKADTFKEAYFKERIVEEDRVEKEFWNVIEDPHHSIQVEYGCDIHTSFQQSGFPQPERHLGLSTSGNNSGDQWNLNALPFSRYSFGRFIDDNVPQLVRPWMNVGMVFSSKSWHVEDFFSAAVSYHHFGDTRTWYAIPEGYSDKVNALLRSILGEETIKENPELFLEPTLFLSPEKLREHGIPCYAVDQHPGQLVVTFPKAYHAHFNHGFNFIEGVNCLPASNWLSYGIECRDLYRELKFPPPFSLEKMALRLHDSNQDFSTYVQSTINKLFTEELEIRQRVKVRYPTLNVTTRDMNDDNDNDSNEPYESRQCARSQDLCFFSWIESEGTPSVAYSLREFVAMEINDDLVPRYRLVENYSTEALSEKVVSQCQPSQAPKNWYRQLFKLFTNDTRPTLTECKELVEEGKRIDGNLEPLFPLQGLVSQANQWAIQARHILDGTSERMLTLVEFQEFLDEIPKLKLTVPEMGLLVERGTKLGEFSREVGDILEMHRINPGGAMEDFEALLDRGRRLNVLTPELELLTRLVERIRWLNSASDVCEYFLNKQLSRPVVWSKGEVPTLEEVSALVTEGRQTNLTEYRVLKALMYQQLLGEQFGVQSQHILDSNPTLAVEDLEKLLEESEKLPVSKRVVVRIKNRLNGVQRSAPESPSEKQQCKEDWMPAGKKGESSTTVSTSCESSAKSLNQSSNHPSSVDDRPSYVSGKKRLEEAISLSSKPNIFALEKEVREVEEWMRKGKRLFGKGNAPLHILQQYLQVVDKKSVGIFCLDDIYDIEKMEPVEKVYCICRSADTKHLIACDICKLLFHTKCLKAGRTKSKASEAYVCPICDWRVPIPRDAQRPTLEELEKWLTQALVLPLKPEELQLLKKIVHSGTRFKEYLAENVIGKEGLPLEALRHYLCKLEGSDLLFAPETNWIRQELHRRAPVADTPPPPVEETQSTRKSKKKSALMFTGDAPLLDDSSDSRQSATRQDTISDSSTTTTATTSFS